MQIEISPNLWMRFRGAEETLACIRHNFVLPASCYGCEADMYCIEDAHYVICPTCRVVSPTSNEDPGDSGGVALGFFWDDVVRHSNSDNAKERKQQDSAAGTAATASKRCRLSS